MLQDSFLQKKTQGAMKHWPFGTSTVQTKDAKHVCGNIQLREPDAWIQQGFITLTSLTKLIPFRIF